MAAMAGAGSSCSQEPGAFPGSLVGVEAQYFPWYSSRSKVEQPGLRPAPVRAAGSAGGGLPSCVPLHQRLGYLLKLSLYLLSEDPRT